MSAGGVEDAADDGGDVNVGATNSSVADPRVDNAGGLVNGSFLGRDIHVLFNPTADNGDEPPGSDTSSHSIGGAGTRHTVP